MANNVIAKIELTPLTPYWRDRLNFFILRRYEVFPITDDMNLESIREGLDKGYIQLVEGSLPLDINKTDCLSRGEAAQMINEAVNNITHPECNITSEEKIDILNRISALENGSDNNNGNESGGDSGDDTPVTPPDSGNTEETNDKFGTYEWKEEYVLEAGESTIDITGSKLLDEFNTDIDIFYDEYYLTGKYEVYAPRLTHRSTTPTTSDDDLVDTLIPLGIRDDEWLGTKQVAGTDLTNVLTGLENLTWKFEEETTINFLGGGCTSPVVIYLIKRL